MIWPQGHRPLVSGQIVAGRVGVHQWNHPVRVDPHHQ